MQLQQKTTFSELNVTMYIQGKFAYAINMYCEIVLNSSYIETDLPSFLPQSKLWPSYIESG